MSGFVRYITEHVPIRVSHTEVNSPIFTALITAYEIFLLLTILWLNKLAKSIANFLDDKKIYFIFKYLSLFI